MPRMGGKVLSERLLAKFPSLKVLFISGHSCDVISCDGVVDSGVAFFQKPFPPQTFAEKACELLDKVCIEKCRRTGTSE